MELNQNQKDQQQDQKDQQQDQKDQQQEQQKIIKYLTEENIELKKTIKLMIWKSYEYRLEEIYHFFDKNGIKKTSRKFDMPITDVINFIIDCDDNECGITYASDYNEYMEEINGKDSNDNVDS
jgi:hypothetical protein